MKEGILGKAVFLMGSTPVLFDMVLAADVSVVDAFTRSFVEGVDVLVDIIDADSDAIVWLSLLSAVGVLDAVAG